MPFVYLLNGDRVRVMQNMASEANVNEGDCGTVTNPQENIVTMDNGDQWHFAERFLQLMNRVRNPNETDREYMTRIFSASRPLSRYEIAEYGASESRQRERERLRPVNSSPREIPSINYDLTPYPPFPDPAPLVSLQSLQRESLQLTQEPQPSFTFNRLKFGELRALIRQVLNEAPENYDSMRQLLEYALRLQLVNKHNAPWDYAISNVNNTFSVVSRNRVYKILERLGHEDTYELDHNCTHAVINAQVAIPITTRARTVYVTEAYAENNTAYCTACSERNFDSALNFVDDEYYCQTCYQQEGFYQCSGCGDHVRETCDREECEGESENNGPPNKILDYSENVLRHVRGFLKTEREPKTKLFFGIELEVLRRNRTPLADAVKSVSEAMNKYAVLKEDSSIGGRGFEIVTIPATLAFHREHLWNEFFKEDGAWRKVRSWNTKVCGLHIHFSRSGLSKMQMAKFLTFLNSPLNQEFLSKIAGRKISPDAQWCQQREKKLGIKAITSSLVNREYGHHAAAVISSRTAHETCEVRIFRGNSSRHGVMRALDFVAAMIQFCGETSGGKYIAKEAAIKKVRIARRLYRTDKIEIAAPGLSAKAFLHWFNKPTVRASYPDLWRQLINLKLLKTDHTFKRMLPTGDLVEAVIESEVPDDGETIFDYITA